MFGLFGYVLICLVVASVLTVGIGLFRPIKQNDEWKPWKWIVGLMAVVGVVPYAYIEVNTQVNGKGMEAAVKDALAEAKLRGNLCFFKLIWATGDKAHVIAVGNDSNEFGWPERTVMEIDLVKGSQGWSADAYTIVNSFHRNRDATTMPPYW